MDVERLPGALQQQRVAGLQGDLALRAFAEVDVSTLPLDGDDDQVAALGDHALEHLLADQGRARRDHDFGEAGLTIEKRILDAAARLLLPKSEMLVRRKGGGGFRVPLDEEIVALGQAFAAEWRAGATLLDGHKLQSAIGAEIDDCGRLARIGRGGANAHLEQAGAQTVLFHQCLGVTAEIGRHGRAAPLGQQPLPKQHDDGERARQQRRADQRELEEAKARQPRLDGGVRDQHVDRRSRERQQRPGMSGKTSGIRSCEGGRFKRTAMTTTTGSRAATAPLTLINAVSRATSRPVSTSSRVRLSSPALAISN